MNIILGSTSPRRKELLKLIFNDFTIRAPDIMETINCGESPIDYTLRISKEKSNSIVSKYSIDEYPALIITSDTIVTIDNIILGKPTDFDHAVEIISLLNGRMHMVISSITLLYIDDCNQKKSITLTDYEISEVTFKKLIKNDIINYLHMIHYKDKAGSYAFQEYGHLIIEGFKGSATNIIGFPLRLLLSMMSESGIIKSLLF